MGHFSATPEVRRSLTARFGFVERPHMQDWAIEVADASRLGEFLAAYRSGELSEAERTVLMGTIVQSLEELPGFERDTDPESCPEWLAVAELLREDARLHAWTIAYWSCRSTPDLSMCWRVSGPMRRLAESLRGNDQRIGTGPAA